MKISQPLANNTGAYHKLLNCHAISIVRINTYFGTNHLYIHTFHKTIDKLFFPQQSAPSYLNFLIGLHDLLDSGQRQGMVLEIRLKHVSQLHLLCPKFAQVECWITASRRTRSRGNGWQGVLDLLLLLVHGISGHWDIRRLWMLISWLLRSHF